LSSLNENVLEFIKCVGDEADEAQTKVCAAT